MLLQRLAKHGLDEFAREYNMSVGLSVSTTAMVLMYGLWQILEFDEGLVRIPLKLHDAPDHDGVRIAAMHELLEHKMKGPIMPRRSRKPLDAKQMVLRDANELAYESLKKFRDAFGLWLEGDHESEMAAWKTAHNKACDGWKAATDYFAATLGFANAEITPSDDKDQQLSLEVLFGNSDTADVLQKLGNIVTSACPNFYKLDPLPWR